MLFISEGSIRVEREDGVTQLRAGDHLAFPTAQQYAYVNAGESRARYVRVVVG
jgi:uncharacterized cupin superfamily protein